jgi:hypothetical protein
MSIGTKPARAADISPEWIAMFAELLRREGRAFRAGAGAATIEVQSINTGQWQAINLETNVAEFASAADRDTVLMALERAVYPVIEVKP